MRVIGIDVGATKTEAVLWDGESWRLILREESTPELAMNIEQFSLRLLEGYQAEVVGVAVAGPVRGREIVEIPNLGVGGITVSPSTPVELINDANAFAFAESRLEYPERSPLLGVTIGTGVGAGLVIDGELYVGRGLACELGHVFVASEGKVCGCGGVDHLEAYFSGRALERELGMVPELALEEKPQEVRRMLRYLARGLANAVHLLDPDIVVIGGGLGLALNLDDLKAELKSLLLPGFEPELVKSGVEHASAIGAALWASDVVERGRPRT